MPASRIAEYECGRRTTSNGRPHPGEYRARDASWETEPDEAIQQVADRHTPSPVIGPTLKTPNYDSVETTSPNRPPVNSKRSFFLLAVTTVPAIELVSEVLLYGSRQAPHNHSPNSWQVFRCYTRQCYADKTMSCVSQE